MLTRLFRFNKYEDIDAKDFAEKTGMNVKSVASMIKQAASNATLYEKMLAAGYTDAEFPSWGYSPGRVGGEGAGEGGEGGEGAGEGGEGAGEGGEGAGEGGEGGELRIAVDKEEGVDGYEVTPPRTPIPREDELGRPALPRATDPIQPIQPIQPVQGVQAEHPFSDAELSLLTERGITEITPGRWMHTQEQADGRIILTRAR